MRISESGINLSGLHEAFFGSEDILRQMLTLFVSQAAERLGQLQGHLAAGDVAKARETLHSLVNICGAVRAFGMSERAQELGAALRAGDLEGARRESPDLLREGALVLRQTRMLLEASSSDPSGLWGVTLPAA